MVRVKLIWLVTILLIINCLGSSGNCFSQVCFSPPDSSAIGSDPFTIVSADFNNDGNADIAAANTGFDHVSILLGTGIGSFGSATTFSVGTWPAQIISEDFNSDGRADLAVCNLNSNDVTVLLGTGTGSFSSIVSYPVGTKPSYLTSSDFNSDGIKDLAVSNLNSDNISLLLGTGTGGFSVASNVLTFATGSKPTTIVSGDFNNDGKSDLALTFQFGTSVSVFLGLGNGTFGAGNNFGVGSTPNVMCFDFNGDGYSDLATANFNSNNVSVLLANNTGSLNPAINYSVSGSHPESITASDFNHDGIVDLAISNNVSRNISLLLGTGGGTFGATSIFACGSDSPSWIINADFNGDTMPDLAVSGTNVGIILNCTSIGIDRFSIEKLISVYPNPATELLSFNVEGISNSQSATITIQNTLGETIKKLPFSEKVDVSDLQPGCYFLQLALQNGETYKTKFIKQ